MEDLTKIIAIGDLHFGSKAPPTFKHSQEVWDQQLVARVQKACEFAEKTGSNLAVVGDVMDHENVKWFAGKMFFEALLSRYKAPAIAVIAGPGHDCKAVELENSPTAYFCEHYFVKLYNDAVWSMGRPAISFYTPPMMNRPDFIEGVKNGVVPDKTQVDVLLLHGPICDGAPFPHAEPRDVVDEVQLVLTGDIHPAWGPTATKANGIAISPGSIVAKTVVEAQHPATAVFAVFHEGKLKRYGHMNLDDYDRSEDFLVPNDAITASEVDRQSQLAQALKENVKTIADAESIVWKMAESMTQDQRGFLQEVMDDEHSDS